MLTVRCTKEIKDNRGVVIGYTIQDAQGNTRDVKKDNLIKAVNDRVLYIDNILVDKNGNIRIFNKTTSLVDPYAPENIAKTVEKLKITGTIKGGSYTKIQWKKPLSNIGTFIGDFSEEELKGQELVGGLKRIKYECIDGNIRYANPYIPGVIIVRNGSRIELQMISGKSGYRYSMLNFIKYNERGNCNNIKLNKNSRIVKRDFVGGWNKELIPVIDKEYNGEAYDWAIQDR